MVIMLTELRDSRFKGYNHKGDRDMKRFTHQSSNPKWNAQRSLNGLTHYVEDDILRFHKSRILLTHITDNGLLFSLVESCTTDHQNRSRGFRYVIFDVTGHIIDRPKLKDTVKTRRQAEKAMWEHLGGLDAVAITKEAIVREERHSQEEIARARKELLV